MLTSVVDAILDTTVVLSFDRSGYERHRHYFDPNDLAVDLTGRVCIVTGASAGLGRAAARGLARLGGEVWLVCRDRARGEETAGALSRETGNPRVHAVVADVSEPRPVQALIDSFPRDRVDVLVHNAGVLPDGYHATTDGLELTLATNVVGPFRLTTGFLPRLSRSPDARVVLVSSGGMLTQRLAVRALAPDPQAPFDGVAAYARTKRAQVVLSELWAERFSRLPITWSAMHPGWADTPGVRQSLPRFWKVMRGSLRTEAQGADTIVWLAACTRVKGRNAKFWFDRRPAPTHVLPWTRETPEEREALWDALQRWAAGPAGSPPSPQGH